MNTSETSFIKTITENNWTKYYWNETLEKAETYLADALEHFIYAFVAYCVLAAVLYVSALYWEHLGEISPAPKRILFVTAHPDDECMFFGPTILRMTANKKCKVYLLCLSKGDYDGVGSTRKQELWEACRVLGIPDDNITVISSTKLQDGPTEHWREDVLTRIIFSHIEQRQIDTVVTFDRHGISKHTNHSSLFYAFAYLCMDKKIPSYCKVYTLETTNVVRKYWLLLDIPLSYLFSSHRYILEWPEKKRLYNAMKRHQSQLVWFRRLYMLFSRYTIINTLQEMNSIDLELELDIDAD